MNYRLLTVDMDGTVLNSEKKISPRTAEAIHRSFEQGCEVVFCTGRNLVEVQPYLDQFPEMEHVVLCSGTVVKDLRTGEDLYRLPLSKEVTDRVVEATRGMDVNVVYFVGDDLYCANSVRGRLEHFNCQCFHDLHEACAVWMEDPYDSVLAEPDRIMKLNLFFHDGEEYDRMGKKLDEIGVNHPAAIPYHHEVSPAGVSKATGLNVLCEHLGISLEQIIACGDEGNDREMILAAGLGVAMGNAAEGTKAIADVIVADCDHDGVAEVIETYLGKPVLKK